MLSCLVATKPVLHSTTDTSSHTHGPNTLVSQILYLCWVFAAEGASPVCPPAPVCIHNDLAPSQACITHWATQNEAAKAAQMCTTHKAQHSTWATTEQCTAVSAQVAFTVVFSQACITYWATQDEAAGAGQ